MTARLLSICFLSGLAAFGQPGSTQTRRADIRGGGGHGKCTIEVEVDGVATVEIRGDTARLRTLEGRPAHWRRFVCNQPMPLNPVEFRFRGIDGRGRQDLIRDPSRGGVAIVRIEDRRGGREGYTFDLEWRGSGGERWDDGGSRPGVGGWHGNRGSTFDFRGDGRGFFNRRSGRDLRVRDVNVSLRQDGRVILEFEAQGVQRLVFAGQASHYSRDSITAELAVGSRSRDTRGEATIYLDRGGQVDRVIMDGRVDGDPFKLTWSAR